MSRKLSARMRNFVLYELWLVGEVSTPGWGMQVDKEQLVAALEIAMRGRRVPERSRRRGPAHSAVFTVCEGGLSVRCAGSAVDVPTIGMWASPIAADGFMALRVLGRIDEDKVQLEYCDGRLSFNERSVRAREI